MLARLRVAVGHERICVRVYSWLLRSSLKIVMSKGTPAINDMDTATKSSKYEITASVAKMTLRAAKSGKNSL
jgi:hypothetical protein